MLASQAEIGDLQLRRIGYKPKRAEGRKLHILQGLPGVGPKLAARLLLSFGSVEAVMCAPEETVASVPGFGPRKAALIRNILT